MSLPENQGLREPDRWTQWAKSPNGMGPWCNRKYPDDTPFVPFQARANSDKGAVYVILE